MIIHCVFCNFRNDSTPTEQADVLGALADFARTLSGVVSFEHGANIDLECKSPDYDAGFVIRFEDQQALTAYAEHPTHQALGARLCDLCIGGADGIIVFDIASSAGTP